LFYALTANPASPYAGKMGRGLPSNVPWMAALANEVERETQVINEIQYQHTKTYGKPLLDKPKDGDLKSRINSIQENVMQSQEIVDGGWQTRSAMYIEGVGPVVEAVYGNGEKGYYLNEGYRTYTSLPAEHLGEVKRVFGNVE